MAPFLHIYPFGAHVAIPDHGIGEVELDKISNPFFTTKDGGTGLGLSVMHQIVTQHGGDVTTM